MNANWVTLQHLNPLPKWETVQPSPTSTASPLALQQTRPQSTSTPTKHPSTSKPTKPLSGIPLALTPGEEVATIRMVFYEDDTMPKEKRLQDAIGKQHPKLVKPTSYAKNHPTAALLYAYLDSCPTDCGLDWSKEHIEAAIK